MYRLPAEWEAQSAMQLTWPHAATDWNYCLEAITRTYVEMASAITRDEPLLVVTPDTESVKKQLENTLDEEQMQRITFCECPTNDTWARDHGFITLVDGYKESKLLDFRFNGWGEKFPAELDNDINRHLFSAGAVSYSLENHDDFVLEGGSIESDGRGTILTTSSCLLAPHRNQPLEKEQIEQELLDRLQAQRILWLDHGHLAGDDTDGHIDTLARFAPGDTILYVQCTDPADEHYDDLRAMEEQLQSFRTLEGNPYRLLPLPMPKAIYEDGERLPATYANFVVLNHSVIVPTYGQPALDKEAMRIIGQAFYGRKVVGIDSRTIIRQHGSIHCCTMQFPIQAVYNPFN